MATGSDTMGGQTISPARWTYSQNEGPRAPEWLIGSGAGGRVAGRGALGGGAFEKNIHRTVCHRKVGRDI